MHLDRSIRGTHAQHPIWFLFKILERRAGQGLLGFRTGATERWFWIMDGHVAFATSTALDEDPVSALKREGIEVGVPPQRPTVPATWLATLTLPPEDADRWEACWTQYYVQLLRATLAVLPDVAYLWVPHTWTPHPRMVAMPIRTWLENAIRLLDDLQEIRGVLERAASMIVSASDPSPDRSVDPTEQRLLDFFSRPLPLRSLLDRPEGSRPETLKALWILILRGNLRLQSVAPSPPASQAERLRRLLDVYTHLFGVVGQYLDRELEDLAPVVMERNLVRVAASHPEVLGPLNWGPDYGILHWWDHLERILNAGIVTLEELAEILEEVLMMHLFSVHTILGPVHYTAVVEILQTAREGTVAFR